MSGKKNTAELEVSIGEQEIAHRVIAETIRKKIFLGEYAPGDKLPSTVEISALWNTSKSTAHTALNRLVKEGLLERHHGSCTYVSEQRPSLDRIGIHYDSPHVWSDEERGFYRSLHGILEEKLKKAGIGISVFVDRRPEAKQKSVLAEIRQAIFTREIQGLIIPLSNSVNLPALRKLPLPVSVMTSELGLPNKVSFDDKKYFKEVLSRLADKGCRSVGFISSVDFDPDFPEQSQHAFHAEDFIHEAEAHGMLTRNEWIRIPKKYVTQKARFGYREFHKLWKNTSLPEAVIVYPDNVVQGTIKAVLELGIHRNKDVTFCFHRNAHYDILCPFPALWTVSDEGKVADALLDQVYRQPQGKSVSPIRLPFDYRMADSTVTIAD